MGLQSTYKPDLYGDLFEKYQPDLVVASTAGWRMDRFLLRQAAHRGVTTAAAMIGWDNPSSYSLPGAPMDFVNCWSDVQRDELVFGSDWPPERVHVGGMPTYDGYLDGRWVLPKDVYFHQHGLDPGRKLLSYACSFVSFSPNLPNVKALASLVSEDKLSVPAQLLIRLHPNHFMDVHLFQQEREQIRRLAAEQPHVHLVEPVALGEGLGHYSGEDMPEKASMMAHADVFLTVYSTMVVEAAIHDRPIVSVCLDTPGGWNWPRKYSLPLSEIGGWPTHARFRQAAAGRVALDEASLKTHIEAYLNDPTADADARRAFVRREITFTDGSAGRRTAEFLAALARSARTAGEELPMERAGG